jgi:DNA repair protein RecO (recombination protein O)
MKIAESTDAFVLRQVEYGDHDKVIGLYTRKYGKISVFAASAKKSQKRFGGSLDLFAHIRPELTKPASQSKSLWRMQNMDLINPYVELRTNLFALSYVSYYADCVWNLLADEDPHEDIFEYLQRLMEWFAKPTADYSQLLRFEIELLNLCGYRPRFLECVECGNDIQPVRTFFSFSKGGSVCPNCFKDDQGQWISADVMEKISQRKITEEKDYINIRKILDHFVTFVVGKELKSQAFRREVSYAGV